MAGYVRLQPLTQLSGDATQRVEAAVDLGGFGVVTVQLRVGTAASAGSLLYLQHAAVLDDDAFTDCAALPLEAVGSQVVVVPAPLRYLRWRATLVGGSTTFLVDLVGREGAPIARWRPLQVIKSQQGVTNAAGNTTLIWDETSSVAVVGDALTWDKTGHAIEVGRSGLLTLHYNVAAWNSTTSPATVNANTWLEEYDGTNWNEIDGTRAYVWATAGTHGVTIQRTVFTSNRKYRVRATNLTVGGGTWRFDFGAFWAHWIE